MSYVKTVDKRWAEFTISAADLSAAGNQTLINVSGEELVILHAATMLLPTAASNRVAGTLSVNAGTQADNIPVGTVAANRNIVMGGGSGEIASAGGGDIQLHKSAAVAGGVDGTLFVCYSKFRRTV